MEGFRKKWQRKNILTNLIIFNFTNSTNFFTNKNPWKVTIKTDWWEESDTVLQIYFRLPTELAWEKKKTKKLFSHLSVCILYLLLCTKTIQKVKNRVSFVAVKAAQVRHLIVFKIGPLNAFLNKLRRKVDLKMSILPENETQWKQYDGLRFRPGVPYIFLCVSISFFSCFLLRDYWEFLQQHLCCLWTFIRPLSV